MMQFIFDLDGTLPKEESLPLRAQYFGIEDEIAEITSQMLTEDYM